MTTDEQASILGSIHVGDGRMGQENYCMLCGIPFRLYRDRVFFHLRGVQPDAYWASVQSRDPRILLDSGDYQNDLVWASYFLALRIPTSSAANVSTGSNCGPCISGIGQYDERPERGRIPPPGYDIRNVLRGRKQVAQLRLLMDERETKEWEGFEDFYSPKYVLGANSIALPTTQLNVHSRDTSGRPIKSIYLMHPPCWDILLQQYALVASPAKTSLDLNELSRIFLQIPLWRIGDRCRPDWVINYAGPERIFWVLENHSYFATRREWHFIARDPGMSLGLDDLLADPPLESTTDAWPRVQFIGNGRDIFGLLPEEILIEVLVLLPSASVRDLQLASRKMASVHLSSRYWRSRFDFPNELCHVKLPPALRNSGQVGERWVDWRCLCDQLLHPVGEQFEWWQNRKRITNLNRKLVESMSRRGSDGRLKEVEGGTSL